MKRFILASLLALPVSAIADSAGDWPPSGSGVGHTIQDEGVSLNQRTQLNFTGAGITCADGSSTTCDVPGPSSATALDQTAGESDFRYEASTNKYYYDTDGDGSKDAGEVYSAVLSFVSSDYDDGTSTTDGINEAIAAACAVSGGMVTIPEGNHATTATIDLSCDGITLSGMGFNSRLIPAAGITAIRVTGAQGRAQIRDLRVSFNVDDPANVAIDLDNGADLGDVRISNVHLFGQGDGIGLACDGCLKISVSNSHIAGWNDGVYMTGSALTSQPNANSFTNVIVRANTDDAFEITELNSTISIVGSTIETNGGYGITCDAYLGNSGYAIIQSTGNHFEGNLASYHRPSGGCAFVAIGDRHSDTNTDDYVKEDSGDKDDVFIGVHWSNAGVVNATGEAISNLFPVDMQGFTCTDSAVCKLFDESTLPRMTAPESITGAWNFTTSTATSPSANDDDTSLATTEWVQDELTAYASDSITFTNKTVSGGGEHDLGGATSLEIPNGAAPTTDLAGEIAFDTDAYAASRGTVEFYDGTSSVFAVATTDAPGDGQVPKYIAASGTIEWQADADSGAGAGTLDGLTNVDTALKNDGDIIVWNATSGKWEDAAPSSAAQAWTVTDPVLLDTTTSDVVVGTGQVNSSKFTIDGDADQVQLTIQGNATQTDSAVILENSGGTEVINLDVSGAVLAQSVSDIDGPGTLWSIDSSGNATFASVTTAASTAPTTTFNDSDSASEATDATISAAATDTGAGTEDVDMGFNVQVNSTLTSRLFIDADGLVEVRAGGLSVDASDPADSGAIRLDNAEGIGWEASPTGTDVTLLADASEIIQIANGFLDGDDILADDIDEGQLAATITFANGDLVDFGTNISSATEGLLIPANATSCATATAEAQICWDEDSDVLSVGTGASTVSFSAGGDNVTVDGGAVTDPDFNDGGDIGFTNTANVITADIDADTILVADVADGDWGDFTIATNVASLDANAVASSEIDTIVQSMFWGAGAMSTDGVQCATPAEVTINSGPKLYSVICTDNDASTMWGSTVMPDGWDGGTVTFELSYVQTAVDTSAMNADVAAACRGSGETINSTLGTEQALDDAAVSGSNIVDHVTSAAVTADGTCAAGDTLWWRVQLDATGTTTAVATLNFLGVKMEFTSNVGD